MNNELARELIEAGFPFKALDANSGNVDIFVYPTDGIHNWVYPTLSEFIEACGKEFEVLTRCVSYGEKGVDNYSTLHWRCHGFTQGFTTGEIPEEAVAKLYLALKNNKKTNGTR